MALAGLIGSGLGVAMGAAGGAVHGGSRDRCPGTRRAALDGALHGAAGGFLISSVLVLPF